MKLVSGSSAPRFGPGTSNPDICAQLGERSVALTWVRTHDWDVSAWRTRSACLDSDPDVFFPIGSSGPAVEQIETARRICGACTVNEECLEFALATNQEAGIWGGATEEERRKLRKVWLAKQRMVG